MLFNVFINSSTRKKILPSQIKFGMNLSEETVARLRADTGFFKTIGLLHAEGLTCDQERAIRDYMLAKKIPVCYIEETIPFSPFIILGVVVTVLAKGSAVHLLRNMF